MHAVSICTQNTKVKQPLYGGSTFVWIEMLMDEGLRDIKKKNMKNIRFREKRCVRSKSRLGRGQRLAGTPAAWVRRQQQEGAKD